MPNPFYTYQIYTIYKHIFLIKFLNEPKIIFFAYSQRVSSIAQIH